jgi:hypothetical protein
MEKFMTLFVDNSLLKRKLHLFWLTVLNFMIQHQRSLVTLFRQNFLESLNYRSRLRGLVGVEHAEGFTVERYLAVNSLTDLNKLLILKNI